MAANMYRVGDCVFFETSSTAPYQIRRIEELNKTASGNVEAKVMCFYRRQDLSSTLVNQADQHQDGTMRMTSQNTVHANNGSDGAVTDGATEGATVLSAGDIELQRQQLDQREVFLSRQLETLPATHIRGKCTVTLFTETERPADYVDRECCFFYSLVYDPQQRSLLADKGEIRVGAKYQADVPGSPSDVAVIGERDYPLETALWTPSHKLSDTAIDQYIVVARSVGTFARALDCSSSVKQPSLHMSAAAASRDVTLFHAMDVLHKCNYDVTAAVSCLVPARGPVLCRDEMEEWSASEAALFEEAMQKYGKDFNDIRRDFLPWKSHYQLVEYYYMWKTTDRYVQRKRVKAVEAETRLKQVYIPSYNKPAAASQPTLLTTASTTASGVHLSNGGRVVNGGMTSGDQQCCAGCGDTRCSQWYAWGASHLCERVCAVCWDYWKKYGDIKRLQFADGASGGGTAEALLHRCPSASCSLQFRQRAALIRHAAASHGLLLPGTGSSRPVTRTRPSFMVLPSVDVLAVRRMCAGPLSLRRTARRPLRAVNTSLARTLYQQLIEVHGEQQLLDMVSEVRSPVPASAETESRPERVRRRRKGQSKRVLLLELSRRLHKTELAHPSWLISAKLTDDDSEASTTSSGTSRPAKLAFPPPPRAPDGSIVYTPVDSRCSVSSGVTLMRKRPLEDISHSSDGGSKRARDMISITAVNGASAGQSVSRNHVNGGRAKLATVTRLFGGRQRVISLSDAPDDVFHVANSRTRMMRRRLTSVQLRSAARRPCSQLPPSSSSSSSSVPAITDYSR